MKFNRIILSFNLKAILLLSMLMCNIFVSASENIKIQKTISRFGKKLESHRKKSHSTSKNTSHNTRVRTISRSRMDFRGRFKALAIGFVTATVVHVLKQASDPHADTYEKLFMNTLATSLDWCLQSSIKEYEMIKKEIIKKSPCDPEVINKILGTSEESKEVQSECAELDTIKKLDKEEFSISNVVTGTIKGFFTDNESFKISHNFFEKKKETIEKSIKNLSSKYYEKFKKIIDDKNAEKKSKEVAQKLFDSMDGYIFKDNVCEAINKCESFGPIDSLKIIFGTSIGFLKCAVAAQVKDPLWYGMQAFVDLIFKQIGVGFLTTLATGIFPGILLGLLVKFVVSNWSALKKFIDSYLKLNSDDPKAWEAEDGIWDSIGRLLAGLLFTLTGLKKRKLKKFRKFDQRLF